MNIVLFDGICILCNSTVKFLIKHDTNNTLCFVAQQTEKGQILLKEYNLMNDNSVILIKSGEVYNKSDAIIEIAKLIRGWPTLLKYAKYFPNWMRNGIYNFVAKYRYSFFGKLEKCTISIENQKNKFLV